MEVGDILWTKTYARVFSKRLANDIFRVLAVEAISPTIYEISSETKNVDTLFDEVGCGVH
jgi:hypothetical protein